MPSDNAIWNDNWQCGARRIWSLAVCTKSGIPARRICHTNTHLYTELKNWCIIHIQRHMCIILYNVQCTLYINTCKSSCHKISWTYSCLSKTRFCFLMPILHPFLRIEHTRHQYQPQLNRMEMLNAILCTYMHIYAHMHIHIYAHIWKPCLAAASARF